MHYILANFGREEKSSYYSSAHVLNSVCLHENDGEKNASQNIELPS